MIVFFVQFLQAFHVPINDLLARSFLVFGFEMCRVFGWSRTTTNNKKKCKKAIHSFL
jgi:hypothetical protein